MPGRSWYLMNKWTLPTTTPNRFTACLNLIYNLMLSSFQGRGRKQWPYSPSKNGVQICSTGNSLAHTNHLTWARLCPLLRIRYAWSCLVVQKDGPTKIRLYGTWKPHCWDLMSKGINMHCDLENEVCQVNLDGTWRKHCELTWYRSQGWKWFTVASIKPIYGLDPWTCLGSSLERKICK